MTVYCRAEKACTEEIFARVVAFSAAGSWRSARREFRRLARRLERHIRLTEDAFFPLFEVKAGGVTGLTLELVDNHRAIGEISVNWRRACATRASTTCRPACASSATWSANTMAASCGCCVR